VPLELPFNLDGISANDNRLDGDFDGRGHSLPAELIPSELIVEGVAFRFGPTDFRARNVVVCRGQTIELPNGDFNRLYLLAASVAGDIVVEFVVDDEPQDCLVPDWEEPIGQWDSRLVNGVIVDNVEELEPGYVKTTPVAWVATHRHARASMADEAYRYGHFFKIALDLPAGARELRLPDDSRVRLLAATVALETRDFLELADPY
jgi:alpha-mannosidase